VGELALLVNGDVARKVRVAILAALE